MKSIKAWSNSETDKALVEVPSSVAGTIAKIHISAGDRVPVGSLLISVEEGEQQVTADPEPEAEAPAPAPEEKPESVAEAPEPTPPAPRPPASTSNGDPIPAAPSTRRFARELGVDLTQVAGSGPGGRISQDDVKAAVRDRQTDGLVPNSTRRIARLLEMGQHRTPTPQQSSADYRKKYEPGLATGGSCHAI